MTRPRQEPASVLLANNAGAPAAQIEKHGERQADEEPEEASDEARGVLQSTGIAHHDAKK